MNYETERAIRTAVFAYNRATVDRSGMTATEREDRDEQLELAMAYLADALDAEQRAAIDKDAVRLFLGGPWDKRTVAVPQNDIWRVPVVTPATFAAIDSLGETTLAEDNIENYRRRRYGVRGEWNAKTWMRTGYIRDLYALDKMSDTEVEQRLRDYLVERWVREQPTKVTTFFDPYGDVKR